MSIDWVALKGLANKQAIEAQLRKIILGTNYGTGPGCWTLTEIINERSSMAESAAIIIAGRGLDGRPSSNGPLRDGSGLPLRFKLRVLSRQACTEAADGKGINNWNSTEAGPENNNNEYCPGPDDPPKPGDMIWIKGDPFIKDPDTGEWLTKRYKMALKARMEADLNREIKPELAHYYYTKVPVGDDGCITVEFDHAMQLLRRKGKRLVLPQFSSGRKIPEKGRRITNWHFEEVPPDRLEKTIKQPSNPTDKTIRA